MFWLLQQCPYHQKIWEQKKFFMLNHIKKYLESIRKQSDSVAFCTFSWNTYRSIESRISALLDWQQSDTVASLPAIPSQVFFFN